MGHGTTYRMIAWLVLASIGSCAYKKAQAEDVSRMELYPGLNRAIAKTLKEARSYDTQTSVKDLLQLRAIDPECYNVWLYAGGFSYHKTGGKANTNHEDNPGLGGAVTMNCEILLHLIAQGMHVFQNSKKGETDIWGFGLEACIRPDSANFCFSLSRVYARASDSKGRVVEGWVPKLMPTLSVGRGIFRLNLTPLDKNSMYLSGGIAAPVDWFQSP